MADNSIYTGSTVSNESNSTGLDKKNTPRRVRYADPNNLYGVKNGVALTPDYTDFCISFELVVRRARREAYMSNESQVAADTNGAITEERFVFRRINTGDTNYSVNTNTKDSYLTTYFTQVDKDDYGNESVSEGLGVTSIDITYENWFYPTVKMRLVDVRGSSLFGVEEMAHDEYGNKHGSRLYEAFFTFPYPEFKLQVKGFYGQAVTFQLCCVDFRGVFNSETGNFECDVTFMGYDYGMISELPMRYIIAAPYCEYYGKDYWDRHVASDPSWVLSDGNKPIKLYELAQKINKTLESSEDRNGVATQGESYEITDVAAYEESLEVLKDKLESFRTNLLGQCDNNRLWVYDGADHNAYGFFVILSSKEDGNRITVSKRDEVLEVINLHNKKYNDDINPELYRMLGSGEPDSVWKNICTRTKNVLGLNFDTGEWSFSEGADVNDTPPQPLKLKTYSLFESGKKPYFISGQKDDEEIRAFISQTISGHKEINTLYCAVVDIRELYSGIDGRIREARTKVTENKENILDRINRGDIPVTDILTVTPNIGNVFKIIMCHVETFLHIVYSCADVIRDQYSTGDLRSKKLLGGLSSDIPDDIPVIYPFSGLTKKEPVGEKSSGEQGEMSNIVCYTADCTDGSNFEETKFIDSFYDALKYVQPEKPDEKEEVLYSDNYLPIAPFECDRDEIAGIFNDNLDSVAGYLATRGAMLFGVMNDSLTEAPDDKVCELMGRMEAYNYYNKYRDKAKISSVFFEKTGGGMLSDIVLNISLCSDDVKRFSSVVGNRGNSNFVFEQRKPIKAVEPITNRQPILKRNNDGTLSYVYTCSSKKTAYIPDGIDSFESYMADGSGSVGFVGKKENANYGCFQLQRDGNVCRKYVVGNSLMKMELYPSSVKRSLVNGRNFDIYAGFSLDGSKDYGFGNEITKKVRTAYSWLQSGKVQYGDYKATLDYTPLLERHWEIDEYRFNGYFSKNNGLLAEGHGFSQVEVFPTTPGDTTEGRNVIFSGWEDKIGVLETPAYSSGELKARECSVDAEDVWVPDFPVCQRYGRNEYRYSIFGHPFYYMQHNRGNMAKCLVFLHSLNYSMDEAARLLHKNSTGSVGKIKSAPYGLLLLLGGIAWRNGQANEVFNTGGDGDSYRFCVDKGKTLMMKNGDESVFTLCLQSGNEEYDNYVINSYVSYRELFDGVDDFVINRLKLMFEEFANGEIWKNIMDGCEICDVTSGFPIPTMSSEKFLGLVRKVRGINEDGTIDESVYRNSKRISEILKRTSFSESYSLLDVDEYQRTTEGNDTGFNAFRLVLRKENTDIQTILKKVYTSDVIVADTCYFGSRYNHAETYLAIKESCYKSYLVGFSNALDELTGRSHQDMVYNGNTSVGRATEYSLKLSLYVFIKHLWDKWLLHDYHDVTKVNGKMYTGTEKWDVKNYFADNFIFIDSYYVNMFDLLKVNCNKFLEKYNSTISDNGGCVSMFLAGVANDNGCMMLGFPGYGYFSNNPGDNSEEKLEKWMSSIFRAYPYSEQDDISTMNKFVVMYLNKTSDIESSDKSYVTDSFDIWSGRNTGGSIGPSNYEDTSNWPPQLDNGVGLGDGPSYTEQMTRDGYYIPSFGLTFSRSNNAILKKIAIGMQSPIITQQTAEIVQNLAESGGSNDHKITYYGQDIYNLYTSYAYTCDVEIMGNAQIMPMMYFQLTNIPMFRGTYMVIQVSHSITPGKMITKIKGQKVSSNQYPFNKEWFTRQISNGYFTGSGSDGLQCSNADGTGKYPVYQGSTEVYGGSDMMTIDDVKHGILDGDIWKANDNDKTYDSNIAFLLNTTINPLLTLARAKGLLKNNQKFTITSGLRRGSNNSEHNYGLAVDIDFTDSPVKNYKLYEILTNPASKIPFNQVILEKCEMGNNNLPIVYPSWIHISSNFQVQRKQKMWCKNAGGPYNKIN